MPDEIVQIPRSTGKFEVRVIALYRGNDPGPFAYLQGLRTGTLKRVKADPEDTEAAKNYRRNLDDYCTRLAAAIPEPVDAILSPPSDLPWQAEPYRKAITSKHPRAIDLTEALQRSGPARAGRGASLQEVIKSLTYAASGCEGAFRRLLIVDDTFSVGTTVAAVIELLQAHGLPETCEIIVACPLWLVT
jgi:hypothetical protein